MGPEPDPGTVSDVGIVRWRRWSVTVSDRVSLIRSDAPCAGYSSYDEISSLPTDRAEPASNYSSAVALRSSYGTWAMKP
jgi:hypothetical protein